jgi:hypothetical protein
MPDTKRLRVPQIQGTTEGVFSARLIVGASMSICDMMPLNPTSFSDALVHSPGVFVTGIEFNEQ